jgi:hypothetical protein
VSHPSLGLPPRDTAAGHPAAGARLAGARAGVAALALEAAAAADPTFRERYSEHALRELLADTQALVDRVALAVAAADPGLLAQWAETVAPRYRKRRVPLDDLVGLAEGIRRAAAATIDPAAMPVVDEALDVVVRVARWHRRIAGDARRRNPVIAFIYKGA